MIDGLIVGKVYRQPQETPTPQYQRTLRKRHQNFEPNAYAQQIPNTLVKNPLAEITFRDKVLQRFLDRYARRRRHVQTHPGAN